MTCINNDIKRGLPCEESKSVLSISISAEAEDKLSITTIDKNSKVSPGNLLCLKRLNAQSTNLAWTSHHLPWWDCWFRRHACHPLTGLNLLLYTFQKKHFYLEGGFQSSADLCKRQCQEAQIISWFSWVAGGWGKYWHKLDRLDRLKASWTSPHHNRHCVSS